MTPKEKAIELVDQYIELLPYSLLGPTPIECALVTVEEMMFFLINNDPIILERYNYWVKVKTELFTMLSNV